jgi:predicted phosphoribosyltransferase
VYLGYEIARNLQLPLDVVLSKKIGHPFNKEFAIEPSRWILPL